MATKSGELREMLLSAIEDVRSGKLDSAQASAIAKLAAQVSTSISVEIAAREAALHAGKLGGMSLGEEASE
jgi:methyl coenzyme M reductase beta subunit